MRPPQIHIVKKTFLSIPCILTIIKFQLLKPFQTLILQLFKLAKTETEGNWRQQGRYLK